MSAIFRSFLLGHKNKQVKWENCKKKFLRYFLTTYGKNLKACAIKLADVKAFLISSSVTFGLDK